MSLDNNVKVMDVINSVDKLDSNFIPANTTFHIEADGSGDFATLQEAITYLQGKYSNGQINIHFGNGTFDVQSTVYINKNNFNIPIIMIRGNGADKTTLNFLYDHEWRFGIEIYKQDTHFMNLHLTTANGRANHHRALYISCGGNMMVENVTADNFYDVVITSRGASATLVGTINVSNCNNLVNAYAGGMANSFDDTNIIANNVYEVFLATLGGFISISTSNYSGTSVTKKSNVSIGTINSNGYVFLNF